jgi:hypothetical protein
MMNKVCDTCANHLGGGSCRAGLESDCAAGEFEAWEPVGRFDTLADGIAYLETLGDVPGFRLARMGTEYALLVDGGAKK